MGFAKKGILTPIHSATFNGLGYNKEQYFKRGFLKKGNIKNIDKELYNYYYKKDLVGEGCGNSLFFTRLGTDMAPGIAKYESGLPIPINPLAIYEASKLHGIQLFSYDKEFKYPNLKTLY